MDLISPLPLPVEDEPFRKRLHIELVSDLYSRAKAALLSLMVVLFVLWHVLGEAPTQQPWIGRIYFALTLVVVLRFAMYSYLEHHPDKLPQPHDRHLLFMLGTFMVGLGYAGLNLSAYPFLGTAEFGMLIACITGINAGALLSMSASPSSYILYMAPSIGTLLFLAATRPKPGYGLILIVLLVVYIAAMLVLAFQLHGSLRKGILLSLRLGETAQRDTLTGLLNRRFLALFMEQEWPRILRSWHDPEQKKTAKSLAIIVVDIDHFKRINDTHGHLAGDAVLTQFAQVLLDTVRQPDVVVRWGGEEFVVLALDSQRLPPLILSERIRAQIEAHEFLIPGHGRLSITCSLGYACLPFLNDQPGHLGWEECIHLADGALYLAKQGGRNRAVGVQEGPSRTAEALSALRKASNGLAEAQESGAVRIV